jgi:hypothetical protein|tara:strand:- start:401 stop:925 length:525 start_codon:yes stop_codon:yes gene_type:complete
MATYSTLEIGHMQGIADKQGITLEEVKRKRALDEEYSTYVDPKLEAARKERLGLTTPTVSEFEPVLNYKPGKGTASHQDTSHIGAEERATGKTLGSTAGSVAGAILGPMVGIPPQVGSAIGGAAGGAIGGGSNAKESAIATAGGAGDAYAKEVSKGKDGKTAGDMMTKIKGIFN